MTLPSSGTLSMSQIKTEFTGPNNLRSYLIGGGYVANHENNSGVPTSGTITVRNLLGKSVNFISDTYTKDSILVPRGTTTGIPYSYSYTGVSAVTDAGSPWGGSAGGTFGTFGSINLVGKAKNATTQVTIESFFDWYDGLGADAGVIEFTGNHTGTWWTTIVSNGITKTRATADIPTGSYYSVQDKTVWSWNASTFNLVTPSTFTINITL